MTKISVTLTFKNDSSIYVSNDKGIGFVVKPDEGAIKASDVFKLFDNGADVCYECNNQAIEPANGHNLTKEQLMFNDCLELIQSVIDSVNQKIEVFRESQKEGQEGSEDKA